MFFTYTLGGVDAPMKKEEATPESLRAAAKVLEEKAKELDKPKITEKQKRLLAIAEEKGVEIKAFKDGHMYDVSSEGIHEYSKRSCSKEGSVWSTVFLNSTFTSVRYVIVEFESCWGDDTFTEVYLDWDA